MAQVQYLNGLADMLHQSYRIRSSTDIYHSNLMEWDLAWLWGCIIIHVWENDSTSISEWFDWNVTHKATGLYILKKFYIV